MSELVAVGNEREVPLDDLTRLLVLPRPHPHPQEHRFPAQREVLDLLALYEPHSLEINLRIALRQHVLLFEIDLQVLVLLRHNEKGLALDDREVLDQLGGNQLGKQTGVHETIFLPHNFLNYAFNQHPLLFNSSPTL